MNNFISPARGRHVVGLVRYLFGPGSSREHTDQRIIAADPVLGVADGTRLDHARDAARIYALGRDLDSHRILLGEAPAPGWVWHCAISLPPDEAGRLNDTAWADLARTAVGRLGFDAGLATSPATSPGDDRDAGRAPCRWIAVHHGLSVGGNDHIHLMVNLVREDGTLAATWNDRRTMSRLCAEAETLHGLRRVEGRAGRGMPGYSKAEHQRLKAGLGLHRHLVARIVRSCALAAADEADFVHLARSSGLEVRPRYNADRTAVTGYSAGLTDTPSTGTRGTGGTDGTVLWFGAGGKLAADLTLPRLREHWPVPAPHTQAATLAAWSQPTLRPAAATALEEAPARRSDASRPVPAGAWAKAAERVDRLTAQLAATPLHDVAAWLAATRQTAAVMAALSLRIETSPGPMTKLADLLAAAAQTPPSQPRVPPRLGALADMRGVAIVARNAPPHPTWTMLLHALADLTHTIAGAQQTSRPRLAAQLATGLARARTAYPLPSARALAAQQRSPGIPAPTRQPRRPAVRRDPPGRGRGRGR